MLMVWLSLMTAYVVPYFNFVVLFAAIKVSVTIASSTEERKTATYLYGIPLQLPAYLLPSPFRASGLSVWLPPFLPTSGFFGFRELAEC